MKKFHQFCLDIMKNKYRILFLIMLGYSSITPTLGASNLENAKEISNIEQHDRSTSLIFKKEIQQKKASHTLSSYGLLAGCLLLGFVGFYLLRLKKKALSKFSYKSQIEISVLSTLQISTKTTLYLIGSESEKLWLVEHHQGVTVIHSNNKETS